MDESQGRLRSRTGIWLPASAAGFGASGLLAYGQRRLSGCPPAPIERTPKTIAVQYIRRFGRPEGELPKMGEQFDAAHAESPGSADLSARMAHQEPRNPAFAAGGTALAVGWYRRRHGDRLDRGVGESSKLCSPHGGRAWCRLCACSMIMSYSRIDGQEPSFAEPAADGAGSPR